MSDADERYRKSCDQLIEKYQRAEITREQLERAMNKLKKLYGKA